LSKKPKNHKNTGKTQEGVLEMMRDMLGELQKSHVLATKHVWCMTTHDEKDHWYDNRAMRHANTCSDGMST